MKKLGSAYYLNRENADILVIIVINIVSLCEDSAESPARQQQGKGTCHMVWVFQNIPGRLPAFKLRGRGVDPGPSRGTSRMAPAPPAVYEDASVACEPLE